ncbi:MAG: protoporphyrinogen oxidase [Deltaproteobacteria bacterium]|nr:protoporphyrinogen oxidase [Deltaproteobacteria bacterium]
MTKRVIIIGSGIAGLAAAYNLREHQSSSASGAFEIVLLEKKDAPGGNIKTEKIDGFLIEGGPDCFLSEKPWAWELCKRLGLQASLLQTNEVAKKTFVLSKGRLHELPEGVILMVPTRIMPLAFSGLISIPGKIRMALELFIPKRKETGDESLGGFVTRRLGKEALDKIAEPLVAGVHAGDPATMSVRSSFPKFVQLEEEHGSLIRGMIKRMALMKKTQKPGSPLPGQKLTMFITLKEGLSHLINTLTERILAAGNTAIRTGAAVTGVLEKQGKFEVGIEGAPSMTADAVIIAAPAYAAAKTLAGLDAELAEKLLAIPYVSTATVSIAFKKKDIVRPLSGFGFVIPRTEGRKIMAATWSSVKWSHRAPDDSVLVRCFVGGAKNAELVNLGDADMIKMVRAELEDIMGIDAEPVLVKVYRWINSMPQYTIGHDERIAEIERRCARYPGLFLTGSAYHGIGIADSVRNAEITAKKVLHFLAGRQPASR